MDARSKNRHVQTGARRLHHQDSRNLCLYCGIDDQKANPKNAIESGGSWSQLYQRGTQFGVYDFLERFAGVRMYFPGELGTIVPTRTQLNIPEINIYDRPDFTTRRISTWWDGEYFEGENPKATINPKKNLNHQRLRWATTEDGACHGLNHFGYIKRFGESHPEYFALMSNGKRENDPKGHYAGQICFTSEVTEEIYQDVRAYLKGESADTRKIPRYGNRPGYAWGPNTYDNHVDVMPQDSFSGCKCEKCQAAYVKKDDPNYATELIWGHVVSWANRLKKEGIKGELVMMAYPPYRRLPDLEIPDNIMIQVAETGPWSKGNPIQKVKDNDEIKAWANKLGHKVFLWNYTNNTESIPSVPQMSPRAFAEYYKELAPWICGAYAQSESKRFLYNYLNYYIYSKVAWDIQSDHNALLKEHYQLMFGKAAPLLQQFYETLEDKWVFQIGGRAVDTPIGPIGAIPSDYDLWNKVYSPAELEKLTNLLDAAEKAVAKDSLEAKRIALVHREYLEPMLNASKNYLEKTKAVAGLKFHCGTEPGKELVLMPFLTKKDRTLLKTVRTGVLIWKTATDLNFRFRCEEPRMSDIAAMKHEPDDKEIWKDSSVEIFLNPSGDRKLYYQIIVNTEGCVMDQKIQSLGQKRNEDIVWNSGAKVQIEKQEKAWIATVSIPLKNLPDMKNEFPANFARNRILSGESDYETLYYWGPFAKGFHDLENYGILTFEKDTNILINSDFSLPEKNGDYGYYKDGNWFGWVSVTNPERKYSMDTETYVTAPYSIRLEGKCPLIAYYIRNLKPNQKYRLSFYMKAENVKLLKKGGGVCANFVDKNNRWYPSHKLMGTTDWVFQSFEVTTENELCNGPYLWMRILDGEGTAWFDDVRLEEINE